MYVRQVDDQTLTLRVSGKLWMRSLIMSDLETDTEWSHLLGRAMAGKLKGKSLEPIVTDMMTWGGWKELYPETTVLNLRRTSPNYTREFYRDPNRFVFGFQVAGKPYALPITKMLEHPVHSFTADQKPLVATFDRQTTLTRLFDATIDGQTLEFTKLDDTLMSDQQTGSRWKVSSGEAIEGKLKGKKLSPRVGIMSFRNAWQNFHPKSKDVEF